MRVIVTGGRDYDDREAVRRAFEEHLGGWAGAGAEAAVTVVDGACPYGGADELANQTAKEMGFRTERVPADWFLHDWEGETKVRCYHRPYPDDYCPAAGPRRNQTMIDRGADIVLAFPGGRGTSDMVTRADRAGVKVIDLRR